MEPIEMSFAMPLSLVWKIPKSDILKVNKKDIWISNLTKVDLNNDEMPEKAPLPDIQQLPGVKFFLALTIEDGMLSFKVLLEHEMNNEIRFQMEIKVKSTSWTWTVKNQRIQRRTVLTKLMCVSGEHFESIFIENDIMTVQIGGCIAQAGVKRKLMDRNPILRALWERDDEKDFAIIVKASPKYPIKVHKWVIKEVSSCLFEKMEEAKNNELRIGDFELRIVRTALDFAYDRDVKSILLPCIMDKLNLLRFAHTYPFKKLFKAVENVLIEDLCDTTLIDYANNAFLYKAERLFEYCMAYLIKLSNCNSAVSLTAASLDAEVKEIFADRVLDYRVHE